MSDHTVELYYDGSWNSILADVRESDVIAIARGRRDWASVTDPATCKLKLNNGASRASLGQFGRYSPRNPSSDLYGKIGRNTPLRVRVGSSRARMYLPGDGLNNAAARAPDAAGLRLTGDQRLEILVNPRSWRPGGTDNAGGAALARRYLSGGDQRAWAWWITFDGRLRFRTSATGTSTVLTRTSSVAVPDGSGELWLAVWLDVDNGASGNTTGFATSTDGVNWTALGANQVLSGATSVFAAQAPLDLGRLIWSDGGITVPSLAGEIGAFRYRSGILATSPLVASADFRTLDTDDTTLTDPQSHVWTIAAPAYVTDRSLRFTGEAAAWPQQWDLSGADLWVSLTAAGITRRLQQGTKALKSSLRRDLSTKANVVAYWPMEEPAGAESFASGLPGDTSSLAPEDPTEAKMAASDLFVASGPLPTLADTIVGGRVPAYTPDVAQRAVFLLSVPDAGISTDRHIARLYTSGSMSRWEIIYAAGGGGRFRGYDSDGTLIFDHGPFGTAFDGALNMHSLWLEQQGSNVFYQWAYFPVGSGAALVSDEGTVAGTFGRFTRIDLGTPVGMDDSVYGHVAILNGDVHNIWDTARASLVAWSGEAGTDRLLRLATDEGLPRARIIGDPVDAEAMGPQRQLTLMTLAREVPTADLGLLTDAPDAIALQYRTRASLYNQEPKLILDYATGVIAAPFAPVEDDQATRNDITVDRVRGSSFTAVQATGPLSTQDPPAGVGVYDYSQELNIDSDARLPDQAGWRLRLGTIDEARYPSVRLNLRNERVAPMFDDVMAVEDGDLIRIVNLPPQVPPGPVDLFVEGILEEISAQTHEIEFNCSPGSAWTVGVWSDTTETPAPDAPQRYDTAGTIRSSGSVTATQTSITLRTTLGPTWTTNPADFPLDVMMGGERMRVTAIGAANGSGDQLFTVVRSINGVIKTHPVGTTVSLADPAVYAL
jgi:hypothetical protein